MNPWHVIDALGRASLDGGLLILAVWMISRWWTSLPAWVRGGMWWMASARVLVALLPLVTVPVRLPAPPVTAVWWPAATAAQAPDAPAQAARATAPDAAPIVARTRSSARKLDPTGRSAIRSLPLATVVARPAPERAAAPRFDWGWLATAFCWIWLGGIGVRGVGLARQLRRVRRARRSARPLEPQLLFELGDGHSARLAMSDETPVPMVTGLLRPLVLIPSSMRNRPIADLRLAVAHELAHVRRGDLWLGWIPALAETVFWFHPLVAVAVAEYSQACEEACDVEALRATGAHPYDYGRLLLAMGVHHRWRGATAMPCGSPNPRHLSRRLSMLEHFAPLDPRLKRAAVALLCGFALVGLAPLRIVPTSAASSAGATGTSCATTDADAADKRCASVVAVTASVDPAGCAASCGAKSAVAVSVSAEACSRTAEACSRTAEACSRTAAACSRTAEACSRTAEGRSAVEAGVTPAPDPPDVADSPDAADPPDAPVPPDAPAALGPDAGTPAPPTLQAAPRAPRAPRAALAFRSSPAWPAFRAPRVLAPNSGFAWSQDDGDGKGTRFAYVLVHRDTDAKGMSGSGTALDWREVGRLKGELDHDFLWVRVGQARFLIDDPDLLARVEDAFAPQSELGRRQSELGAMQSRLGEGQSEIGVQQSRLGQQQSRLGAEQARLATEMARRSQRQVSSEDLEQRAEELSDQMDDLGRAQERLSSLMEPLSEQQEKLGAQMEILSRQMEQVSREASREVRALIEQAIRDGRAKPLE